MLALPALGRTLVAGLTIAIASFTAAPALAQGDGPMPPESDGTSTPQQYARLIGAVTLQGLDNVRTNTRVTIAAIASLANNDAPNAAIATAARGGADRTAAITQNRIGAIQAITEECVSRLTDAGAPNQAIEFVLNVSTAAQQLTRAAAEASPNAIRTAAERASDPGGPGDDSDEPQPEEPSGASLN